MRIKYLAWFLRLHALSFGCLILPGLSFAAENPPSPASLLAEVKAPPGFNVTIFAEPPNVSYPTCIAAEPNGDIFVGVDLNGSLDAAPGRGWVVRCRDTNNDGAADEFITFAKMDSPRGIVFDHGTLYVMHPPVVEAFYDDNGDGVSDRSEVLVRGLAHDLKFRGADHTCNGMRMGIDGWLYIALGDYGALEAVGKDGHKLQVHGGGIVRVRLDGTELEQVVQGTRNIYDVAIDPLMNLFTCDNTNDGDEWNVRLSHMISTANYGYPILFKHFPDEIMPTMMDYGGGSPTGSLFLDEPGFPNALGYGLYTCQWGWNNVTRHPLTADGGTFKAGREKFIEIPRPTGIDADGEGNIYVASWKGATFTYAGPNAGYVIRATPPDNHSNPFPDLAKATPGDLLKLMASPSAVWRLKTQREILRRSAPSSFAKGLESLANSKESLPVRVAALYTLKQMLGAGAQTALLKMAQSPDLKAIAIHALADRMGEAGRLPTKVLTDALTDHDPLVRREAVIALNRLDRKEAADKLLPLANDSDIAVAHVAYRAMVALHGIAPCFATIDQANATYLPGAMRVLRNIHDAETVDGLIARVNKPSSSTEKPVLEALCRLYYREADWDGSWWGTRPDIRGPFFKPVTWAESDKIAGVLKSRLSEADDDTTRFLLTQFQRHRIDLPGLAPTLVKMATDKPGLRNTVMELFAHTSPMPPEALNLMEKTVLDPQQDSALRASAFATLTQAADQQQAVAVATRVLAALSGAPDAKSFSGRLRGDFINDGRHSRNVSFFAGLTRTAPPAERQLAYAVLLEIAENPRGNRQAIGTARRTVAEAWEGPDVASLMHAVGETRMTNYGERVRSMLADKRPEVASAAADTLKRLTHQDNVAAVGGGANAISKLPYEEVLQEAVKTPGDPKMGAQLFEQLGCVKCHTYLKSEPLKGPFLGDIAARYGRPEIIESILRPNAQIAQGFQTATVETKDGDEFDGFIVRESGDEIEIRNINGPTVIQKKNIAKRGTGKLSIMPEGLTDQITPGQLASLLAFLQSLKGK